MEWLDPRALKVDLYIRALLLAVTGVGLVIGAAAAGPTADILWVALPSALLVLGAGYLVRIASYLDEFPLVVRPPVEEGGTVLPFQREEPPERRSRAA